MARLFPVIQTQSLNNRCIFFYPSPFSLRACACFFQGGGYLKKRERERLYGSYDKPLGAGVGISDTAEDGDGEGQGGDPDDTISPEQQMGILGKDSLGNDPLWYAMPCCAMPCYACYAHW